MDTPVTNEAEISDAGFLPVSELMADLDSYETWSKICLESLFGWTNSEYAA